MAHVHSLRHTNQWLKKFIRSITASNININIITCTVQVKPKYLSTWRNLWMCDRQNSVKDKYFYLWTIKIIFIPWTAWFYLQEVFPFSLQTVTNKWYYHKTVLYIFPLTTDSILYWDYFTLFTWFFFYWHVLPFFLSNTFFALFFSFQ